MIENKIWPILLFCLSMEITSSVAQEREGSLKKVLTPRRATAATNYLRTLSYFRKVSKTGQCHPRADVANYILDTELGIYSRKIWVHGAELYPIVEWNLDKKIHYGSHVATLIRVGIEANIEDWIIDLLFEKPLPIGEWLRRLGPKVMNLDKDILFIDPKTLDGGPYPADKCLVAITERFHDLGPNGQNATGWDADFVTDEMKKLEKYQLATSKKYELVDRNNCFYALQIPLN